jgi:TatD DNase family protein
MSSIIYIDNHCHLNLPEFDNDYVEVYKRAVEDGVQVINVGTDKVSSKKAVDLADELGCFAIVGLHPNEFALGFDYEYYKSLAIHPRVVGIGECGLDYFRSEEDTKEKQKEVFKKQIELALEVDKPLMLHIRDSGTGDAYRDVLDILKSYIINQSSSEYPRGCKSVLRGDVHFFAGTLDIAKEFLALGFTLSFTGAITYPPRKGETANQYEEIIKHAPLDRILSETDCPFVAPVPYRGQRNEPGYVVEVVKKIAEIKGLPVHEVAKQLIENSKKLFGI